MKPIKVFPSEKGMGLVEIMIAMLLGVFLIGGVIQIFLSSKQTFRIQDGLAGIQENGRFSMDYLSRDMRMTDFWACVDSVNIESKLKPNAVFDDFDKGLEGIDNLGLAGSDSITLRGLLPSNIFVVTQPTTVSANLTVTNDSGLKDGDVVLLSDCRSGDIFQIINLNPSNNTRDVITHSSTSLNKSKNVEIGPESPPPVDPLKNRYGTDAQIFKLAFIQYSIRLGPDGQPGLYKSLNGSVPEEIVAGVEDMQIKYGEETDANPGKSANYYVDAGDVVDWDRVTSLRVSLLLRSIKDNLTSTPLEYTFNGATTLAADRRLRRVFTSTIALRNRI